MPREREAFMPAELIRQVLERATPDVVLVGGQALAFWIAYYDIPEPELRVPAISRDVDFFTPDAANAAPLAGFAQAIGGTTHPQAARTITALIGHAEAPAGDGRVYNVDLIHTVVGLSREQVEANAVSVALPGASHTLRVMHPIDVLKSRNANLHVLADKQDELGQLQLRLAIDVSRAYLLSRFDDLATMVGKDRERAMLDEIAVVDDLAKEDAAKKNATRYDIHLADAIPAWGITSPAFWQKQWPRLRSRMSPGYAARCEELAPRGI